MVRSRSAQSWFELFPYHSPVHVFLFFLWLLFFVATESVAIVTGSSGTFGYFDSASLSFEELNPARTCQIVLLVSSALFWGLYRAVAFNPFYETGYLSFLRTVPWRFDSPLPLGPLRLTITDGVVGVVLSLLVARGYTHGWGLPLIVGLLAYGLPILLMLYMVGATGWFFALALTVASLPYVHNDLIAMVVWLGLIVAMLVAAVGTALRTFPWDDAPRLHGTLPANWYAFDLSEWFGSRRFQWYRAVLDGGWPLGAMSPSGAGENGSRATSVAWCCLIGWCAASFAPVDLSIDQGLGDYAVLSMLAVPFYGIARSSYLRVACLPPISLFGRIFTLRWIIPRFDVVYLPTIVGFVWTIIAAVFIAYFNLYQALPIRLVVFIAVAGGMSLVAILPPHSRAWWLTGGYSGKAQKTPHLKQR